MEERPQQNNRRFCVWDLCFTSSGLSCEKGPILKRWKKWVSECVEGVACLRPGWGKGMEYPQSKKSEPPKEGIRQLLWQPGHGGREGGCRRAPGRRYLSCNKCLQLEPKVMSGSCALNLHTNVSRHTLCYFFVLSEIM